MIKVKETSISQVIEVTIPKNYVVDLTKLVKIDSFNQRLEIPIMPIKLNNTETL